MEWDTCTPHLTNSYISHACVSSLTHERRITQRYIDNKITVHIDITISIHKKNNNQSKLNLKSSVE
jgi:hypothetical protein